MVDLNEWESAIPIEKNLQSDWDAAEKMSLDIPGEPSVGDLSKAETNVISKVGREALQLGGMVGGGFVGAAAAPVSPAGPFAPALGGTIGYGMGANLADRLDIFLGIMDKPESSLEHLKTGAQYEMIGGSIVGGIKESGKALWWMAEKTGIAPFLLKIKEFFPKMSDEAIILKAKEILEEVKSSIGEQGKKTAKETKELLKRLDVKTTPTPAQVTGSPRIGAYEQSASAKNAELMAILKQQDAAINQEAIAGIEGKFKEPGTIGDVISGVKGQQQALEGGVTQAQQGIRGQVGELATGQGPQAVGHEIKSSLDAAKAEGKRVVDELYAQIPKGVELEPNLLGGAVTRTITDFSKVGGGKSTLPTGIIGQIKSAIKTSIKEGRNGNVTFENLQDWSSQIGREIREYSAGANPNLKMVRRLKMLREGIDETMDKMLEHGDANVVEAYRTAKNTFVDYLNKYRKGTVGEVLQPGNLSTGNKVAFSDIPGRFFKTGKMDISDDLIRAVGQENAAKLIEDYASHDLLSRAGTATGELTTKTAQKWLSANSGILKKYGLFNKYKQIVQSQIGLDTAVETLTQFNKTSASKILNSDVDKVIENIFSGASKKNGANVANKLFNTPGIKGNAAAINGIKNSFKDFILKRIELTGVDVLGNPIRSLAKAKTVIYENLPAMMVIYKDNPEQIRALLDYHKLLEALSKNKNVTYSGGSTTTEKMAHPLSRIFSNAAQLLAVKLHKGGVFNSLKNLAKAIIGSPGKYTQNQVETLLREAIYNPEVAKTIMAATKTPSAYKVKKELSYHLLKMGIYTADKLTD